MDSIISRIILSNPLFLWNEITEKKITIKTTGFLICDQSFFSGTDLTQWFYKQLFEHPLKNILEKVHLLLRKSQGNFCVIIDTQDYCLITVDRVRSIPLFWGNNKNEFFISDSALEIHKRIPNSIVNKHSIQELRLTFYVTGNDTIFSHVYQLKAGEFLFIDKVENKLTVHNYYQFLHEDIVERSEQELNRDFNNALNLMVENLLISTKGHRLVVPLSGGLDSRLLVVVLKNRGIKDVICFTYGANSNWESQISQDVANRLGYKWFFVPYTREKWRKTFPTNFYQQYLINGSNYCSIAVGTNWLATKELLDQKIINESDFIVPGHTGDYISGGHLPSLSNSISKSDLIYWLFEKQFKYWNWNIKDPKFEWLRNKTHTLLPGSFFDSLTPDQAANLFDLWEWQERQSKYIINSVRVFDFFNVGWRIPLWDTAMLDFWSKVPYSYRYQQSFYKKYLSSQLFSPLGIDQYNISNRQKKMESSAFFNPIFGSYNLFEIINCWLAGINDFGFKPTSLRYIMRWNVVSASTQISLLLNSLKNLERQ